MKFIERKGKLKWYVWPVLALFVAALWLLLVWWLVDLVTPTLAVGWLVYLAVRKKGVLTRSEVLSLKVTAILVYFFLVARFLAPMLFVTGMAVLVVFLFVIPKAAGKVAVKEAPRA